MNNLIIITMNMLSQYFSSKVMTTFSKFVQDVNADSPASQNEALKDYMNYYITFLLVQKKSIEDIKNIKMKLLINYYIDNYNTSMTSYSDLEVYYKKNIKDNFNPVLLQFPTYIKKIDEDDDKRDEDIELHYKEVFSRHLIYTIYKDEENTDIDTFSSYCDENNDNESLISHENYSEYSEYNENSDYNEYNSNEEY